MDYAESNLSLDTQSSSLQWRLTARTCERLQSFSPVLSAGFRDPKRQLLEPYYRPR